MAEYGFELVPTAQAPVQNQDFELVPAGPIKPSVPVQSTVSETKEPTIGDIWEGAKRNAIGGYLGGDFGFGLNKALATDREMPEPIPVSKSILKNALGGVMHYGLNSPYYILGGFAGAPAGPIGAGAGAFALPTAYEESLRSQLKGGEDITGSDILKETGKMATVGAATSLFPMATMAKYAPTLSKLPFIKSLATAGEVTTLAGLPPAMELEPMTKESLAETAGMILMLKGSRGSIKALRDYKRHIEENNIQAAKEDLIKNADEILADPNIGAEKKAALKVQVESLARSKASKEAATKDVKTGTIENKANDFKLVPVVSTESADKQRVEEQKATVESLTKPGEEVKSEPPSVQKLNKAQEAAKAITPEEWKLLYEKGIVEAGDNMTEALEAGPVGSKAFREAYINETKDIQSYSPADQRAYFNRAIYGTEDPAFINQKVKGTSEQVDAAEKLAEMVDIKRKESALTPAKPVEMSEAEHNRAVSDLQVELGKMLEEFGTTSYEDLTPLQLDRVIDMIDKGSKLEVREVIYDAIENGLINRSKMTDKELFDIAGKVHKGKNKFYQDMYVKYADKIEGLTEGGADVGREALPSEGSKAVDKKVTTRRRQKPTAELEDTPKNRQAIMQKMEDDIELADHEMKLARKIATEIKDGRDKEFAIEAMSKDQAEFLQMKRDYISEAIEQFQEMIELNSLAPADYNSIVSKYTVDDIRARYVALYRQLPSTRWEAELWDAIAERFEDATSDKVMHKTTAWSLKDIAKKEAKGIITKEEAGYMRTVYRSLKQQPSMKVRINRNDKSNVQGSYDLVKNLLEINNPYAKAHEVGHWAFYNVLDKADRKAYRKYILDELYEPGEDGKLNRKKILWETTDLFSADLSASEMFASKFSDFFNEKTLTPTEKTLFTKVLDWFKDLKQMLKSRGGDVKFDKIESIFNKVLEAEGRRNNWREEEDIVSPLGTKVRRRPNARSKADMFEESALKALAELKEIAARRKVLPHQLDKTVSKSLADKYKLNFKDFEDYINGEKTAKDIFESNSTENSLAFFKSKLEDVVKVKPFTKMDISQLKKMLENNGVTRDEISKVLDGLEGVVTRQEVLDAIKVNKTELKDVTLGEIGKGKYGEDEMLIPHYEQYSEPGYIPGSYRERFVTAPKEKLKKEFNPLVEEFCKISDQQDLTNEQAANLAREMGISLEDRSNYITRNLGWQDGHSAYSNIQNPVVRLRTNDRVIDTEATKAAREKWLDAQSDPNKKDFFTEKKAMEDTQKRILFIEEMQEPLKSTGDLQNMPKYLRERTYDLGVKKALMLAKEGGYDGVAWTTGEMQVARYPQIREFVDNISWTKTGEAKVINIKLKSGHNDYETAVINKDGIVEEGRKEWMNKHIAQILPKKTSEEILTANGGHIKGEDITIGDKGLKDIYDRKLPSLFKKYGKEDVSIINIEHQNPDLYSKDRLEGRPILTSVPYIPITPKTPGEFALYSDPFGFQAAYRGIEKYLEEKKLNSIGLTGEIKAISDTIHNKFNSKDMTTLETVLKSPEWFNHPEVNKIVKLFTQDSRDIYHNIFNELNLTDHPDAVLGTLTKDAKALRNKGLSLSDRLAGKTSEEYKHLQKIIDEGDTTWVRTKNISPEDNVKLYEAHIRKQGATEDTIRIWKLYRESYDRALDIHTEQIRKMIDDITEESRLKGQDPDLAELNKTLKGALAQMEEWRGFYAPRVREFGNWKVQAYKEHGPMEENREWYREHKGSELSARRLANKLEKEGWKIFNVGEMEYNPKYNQNINAVMTAKMIESALEKLKTKDTYNNSLLVKVNEEILREVATAIKSRGYKSSTIHRAGSVVKGYIEDPIQRHLMYTNTLSRGISKSATAKKAYEILLGQHVNGQKIGGIDSTTSPKAFETAQEYINNQLRNTDAMDKAIGIAKSITTFKFLGFNLRSIAVNLTAMASTAPASIHQYALGGKGSMLRIGAELGLAGKDYGKVMTGGKLYSEAKASKEGWSPEKRKMSMDEQLFLDDMHKKGWDDAKFTREAMGELSETQSKAWNAMMETSMWLFGKSEQWNRGTTMLAAYRMARRNGISHEEAATLARTASDKAHGTYGQSTNPMWAEGTSASAKTGQMLYVYSKFGHNYLQLLYDLGANQKNVKALLYASLAPIVIAGVSVAPFKDAIFAIAGGMLQAMGIKEDPEKWLWETIRDEFGFEGEKVARHGLLGAAGVDVSGSLSIGIGIPQSFLDFTGAIGGAYTDITEGVNKVRNGQYARAVEHILPAGVSNLLRAKRESEEGITTRDNYRVWNRRNRPYVPSTKETITRAVGFRSADQAVLSDRTFETQRERGNLAKDRSDIYEKYRAWIIRGKNPDEKAEIFSEVREYNKYIRDNKIRREPYITRDSLKRQVRGLRFPNAKDRQPSDIEAITEED